MRKCGSDEKGRVLIVTNDPESALCTPCYIVNNRKALFGWESYAQKRGVPGTDDPGTAAGQDVES